jgi:hypothetical protein
MATKVLVLDIARARSAMIASFDADRGRFNGLARAAALYKEELAGVLAGVGAPCRLPTDAEWEWVAREGDTRSWVVPTGAWLNFRWDAVPNAFGIQLTGDDLEWVASADTPFASRGVHSGWQDQLEAVVTACGYRQEGGPDTVQCLRFALDLP